VLQLIIMTIVMLILPIIYCLDVSSSPRARSIDTSTNQAMRWKELALQAEELLFRNFKRATLVYFLPLLAVGLSFLPLLPFTSLFEFLLYLILIVGIPFVFAIAIAYNREINRSWEEEYAAKTAASQDENS
jgi:positive regulator of sigma E activity